MAYIKVYFRELFKKLIIDAELSMVRIVHLYNRNRNRNRYVREKAPNLNSTEHFSTSINVLIQTSGLTKGQLTLLYVFM